MSYLSKWGEDNIPLRRVVGSPDWLGAERETRESFLEEVDKKSGELTKDKGQQGRQRGPGVGVCRKENARETGERVLLAGGTHAACWGRLQGHTHTHTMAVGLANSVYLETLNQECLSLNPFHCEDTPCGETTPLKLHILAFSILLIK